MPRTKGQTDDIHIKIRRGLRDASIDHMAIEDPRCWPWQGALTKAGYARLGKQVVHHILFELHIRTIPGEEDYKLPAAEYEGTLYHKLYPNSLDGKRLHITPYIYGLSKCGLKACINPYHRDWKGIKHPKPYDWNPEKDDPRDLIEPVPALPTAAPVNTLTAEMTLWLQPGDRDRPFDELFEDVQLDFCEHPVDEIREALKSCLRS